MRRILVIVAVLGQLLVLAYMAGKREWIYYSGERVFLRTAPIDPSDPFRGEFVRLQYPFSNVSTQQWQGEAPQQTLARGTQVFAVLRPSAEGRYDLDYLRNSRPSEGLYMTGRTTYEVNLDQERAINVRYGIEQYYVEQGRGREIENKRGQRDGLQVPMEMEVALGTDGTAVLRAYRWSRLGMQLEILRAPQRQRPNEAVDTTTPRSPKIRVSLVNVSDAALLIADPGDHCGFELRAVQAGFDEITDTNSACSNIIPLADDLHRLDPGQSYAAELDFVEPRWHTRFNGETQEIGSLNEFNQFRVVYRSPAPDTLPAGSAELLWQGDLPSRAFRANGNID